MEETLDDAVVSINSNIQEYKKKVVYKTCYCKIRERISDWNLVFVNAITAGLEMVSSVVFTIIPPMLLKLGYNDTQMSMIFGVAPFICLFVVPIVGAWSDRLHSSCGRRKPILLVYSIALVASMTLLCLAEDLVSEPRTKYHGICLVTISVILVDFVTQAAINPCEALVADTLHNVGNTERLSGSSFGLGFKTYSYMTTLGSCIGYLLAAVDWNDTVYTHFYKDSPRIAPKSRFTSDQSSFILVTMIFTCTSVITILSASETRSNKFENVPRKISNEICETTKDRSTFSQTAESSSNGANLKYSSRYKTDTLSTPRRISSYLLINLVKMSWVSTYLMSNFTYLAKVMKHTICVAVLYIVDQVIVCFTKILFRPFVDVCNAPSVILSLFWTDLFCWMALMGQMMYITDYMATVVYQGDPSAKHGSKEGILFDDGVRMGSFGMLLHSVVACVFAMCFQDTLIKRVGMRATYIFGLLTFALSMLLTLVFPFVTIVNISAALSGFGTAVANTIPGTLITKYHAFPELYLSNANKTTVSRKGCVGRDMAIIDTTFYLAQIILSFCLGRLVDSYGKPHIYIGCSSLCAFVSAYFATKIVYNQNDLPY